MDGTHMKPPVLSRPDTIRRRLKNTGHAGQISSAVQREIIHDICDELDELRARIEKAERDNNGNR